jgi:hypothetical protein
MEQAIATVTPQTSLPASKAVMNKRGKVISYVQHFTGSMSAKLIKEALKAKGVEGKELTSQVNEVLLGEKDLRQQLGQAWLQAAFQDGMMPDFGKTNKKGDKATLSLVKVTEKDRPDAASTIAALKAGEITLTDEEEAELLNLLASKKAPAAK